jgi:hypothetical protein
MKPNQKTPIWKYRTYWYLAYAYFQNEHFFNSFVANLKGFLSGLEDRFYKNKWEKIELRKPIFIIGPGRSGTTILQQVLSLHSAVATPRTYSDMFDLTPILAKKFVCPLIRGRTNRRADRIMVGIDTPQEAQGLILRYFNKELVVYNPTSPDDIKIYMRKLLYLESKTRFLWKVPYLTIRVPDVIAMFPDARLIYLHRNPVASVNSKMKFIDTWKEMSTAPSHFYRRLVGKNQSFEKHDLSYFMEQANRMVNLEYAPPDSLAMARDHLQWIERALMDMGNLGSSAARCFVDFATLIQDPRSSLRSLFEFLELPDESEAILAKLEELGMPLGMPELKLDHIPEESLPAIEEMCREHLSRCSSAVDWKGWRTIGPVLSESYS